MRYFLMALLMTAPELSANAGDLFINPFSEGTQKTRLTAAQRESLSSFIEATRDRLERVVEDVRGMPHPEAERLYKDALIATVIDSYRLEGRTELLTRYVINQGLELTYGIPTADGKSLTSRGVLPSDDRYQGLRVLILEDSVNLALAVLPEDEKILKNGELIDLPFIPFAYTRLKVARMWSAGIFGEKTQYLFMLKIFEHWLSTVATTDQLHQVRLASQILEVERFVGREDPKIHLKDKQHVSSRLREMRKLVRRVLAQEVNSIEGFTYPGALKHYSAKVVGTLLKAEKDDAEAEINRLMIVNDWSKVRATERYEEGKMSERRHILRKEDERRNSDKFWKMRGSVAASLNSDGEAGGKVGFELDQVLRDTKVPGDGHFAHIDVTARGYKNADENGLSRSQVRARVIHEWTDLTCKAAEQADGICDESRNSGASFNILGAVFKRNTGTVPERTENSVSLYTLGTRWTAQSKDGYFLKGDIAVVQPGLNLTGDANTTGWQLRYFDASLKAGYRAENGFEFSNRLSTSMGHGDYVTENDARFTYFGELENELKVRLPHVPLYVSWNAERQSVKPEESTPVLSSSMPDKPWQSKNQHMFNLGVDF